MTKKIEVSIFYGGFTFVVGGVNFHLQSLKDGLQQQGCIVNAYTLDNLPFVFKYIPHFLEKVINFFNFPMGFIFKGLATKFLFRTFFEKKVDYFIFEDIYLSWNSDIPSVTILHAVWSDNLQSYNPSSDQMAALKNKEIKLMTQIQHPLLTVSQPYLDFLRSEHFLKKINKTIHSVPLGIDQSDFQNFESNFRKSKAIIYTGALEPRKNVIFLLEVFKRLFQFDSDYTLTIIGDGPDREKVDRFISKNNLPVKLLGRVSHQTVIQQLFQHELYMHSSTKESFSYALLEAKLAGLVTIANAELQVPEEFIDIKIKEYNPDSWFDVIINHNHESQRFDSANYSLDTMTTNTIKLAR
jgi:glycosyltransferase involved in cell wall biosynthesis